MTQDVKKYFRSNPFINKSIRFVGTLNLIKKLLSPTSQCNCEKINQQLMINGTPNEEIAASMSHELITPVVAIKAYTYMLLDGKFGEFNYEQKEKLNQVKINVDLLIEGIFKTLNKNAELFKKV